MIPTLLLYLITTNNGSARFVQARNSPGAFDAEFPNLFVEIMQNDIIC
jgi:hypothetical protein